MDGRLRNLAPRAKITEEEGKTSLRSQGVEPNKERIQKYQRKLGIAQKP